MNLFAVRFKDDTQLEIKADEMKLGKNGYLCFYTDSKLTAIFKEFQESYEIIDLADIDIDDLFRQN